MGLGFTSYDLENDDRFLAYFRELERTAGDHRFALNETQRILRKFWRANFILSGPGQYPDLSPEYADRKEDEVGFVYPILVRSGFLRDSVIDAGHPKAITRVGTASLVLGTSVPWAAYNQEGWTNTRTGAKGPARKFMFLTDAIVGRVLDTFKGSIERKHRKKA